MRIDQLRILSIPAVTLLGITAGSAVGASTLFNDDAVIDVALTGPLETLLDDTRDRKQHAFVLRAHGKDHEVKVRVRGKSRVRICSFPPLRINFNDQDTIDSVFEGQDKLRVVTHCRRGEDAARDALEEYAAYRIFNLVSDVGYRVRLLRVTYVDTEGRRKYENLERFAFLIESDEALAERTGGRPAYVDGVSLRSLDEEQAATVYVFQYLIGNTEWSLVKAEDDEHCCHNGDLFEIDSNLFYVPYDFDLAGLVDADYAYPDPSLPIRKVTQRYYRGFCASGDAVAVALDRIVALKDEVMGVPASVPGLSDADIAAKKKFGDQISFK